MELQRGSLKEQSIMKILILGAGRVGSSLAEMLVSDDKSDVTVVDTHTEALDNLQKDLICEQLLEQLLLLTFLEMLESRMSI